MEDRIGSGRSSRAYMLLKFSFQDSHQWENDDCHDGGIMIAILDISHKNLGYTYLKQKEPAGDKTLDFDRLSTLRLPPTSPSPASSTVPWPRP